MLDTILYELSKVAWVLPIFLGIILLLSFIMYLVTKKFNIHKKSVILSGMFMGLSNKQIIMIISIFIRTFLVIFTACVYTKNILLYLLMIAISSIIFAILNYKKAILEIVSTIAQIIALYLINILTSYMIEESNDPYVLVIKICLIIFLIVYAIYFFLKNFEDIITNHKRRTVDERRERKSKEKRRESRIKENKGKQNSRERIQSEENSSEQGNNEESGFEDDRFENGFEKDNSEEKSDNKESGHE
jgi:signal transduction histidine kinase